MPNTPAFDVQVVGPDDYAVIILVDNDGRASMRSAATPEYVGDLLTRMTGRFHQTQNLPMLVTDELRAGLTAAGWVPPFDPADHELSDHDWMELVAFDSKCENEGFGYAAEHYSPKFKDEALAAEISHAPMDRLKKLAAHHQDRLDGFWDEPGAIDRINAHNG